MSNNWTLKNKSGDIEGISRLFGVNETIARVMVNRGINTIDKAARFLKGNIGNINNPLLMKDMCIAISLLFTAIKKGSLIAIGADYDADGIFSSEILKRGIEELGGMAIILTPLRSEGYGLNRRVVDDAVIAGAELLITCDNGIAASDAIEYANSKGLITIVTDHHEVPFETDENGEKKYILPPALAVVDPKQADCPFPFKGLCGAGVAYGLISSMYNKMHIDRSKLQPLLEYAAIATVADVMDLVDDNRIIVKEGLRILNNTENPGLRALISVLGFKKEVTAGDIGFFIGPCFNASGRLENIDLAHALLNAPDSQTAEVLANQLVALNDERKQLTEDALAAAQECVTLCGYDKRDKIIVVPLQNVSESIVGIVAGRLKEKYHRPVICLARIDGDLYKGSCRSVEAYNIYEGLTSVKECLEGFGGHAMAAGLTIKASNVDRFRALLNMYCPLSMDDLQEHISLDGVLDLTNIRDTVEQLKLLEPMGKGNPKPVFGKSKLLIRSVRLLGQNKATLKLSLEDFEGNTVDALMFNGADYLNDLIAQSEPGNGIEQLINGELRGIKLTIAGYPELNEFNGSTTPQIIIKAAQIINPKPIKILKQCFFHSDKYCFNGYDCSTCAFENGASSHSSTPEQYNRSIFV